MKKIAYYISVIGLVLFHCPVNAAIIDQSQTSYNGGIAFWQDERAVAQTFAAGMTGYLDSILLDIGVNNPSNLPPGLQMHFSVAEWSGSTPGSILGSVDILADAGFITGVDDIVDFSSQGIFLTSGSLYALILTNDASYPDESFNTGVRTQWDGNLYAAGNMWTVMNGVWIPHLSNGNSDLYFTTYMAKVAEPGTLLLFCLGLLGMRFIPRRT